MSENEQQEVSLEEKTFRLGLESLTLSPENDDMQALALSLGFIMRSCEPWYPIDEKDKEKLIVNLKFIKENIEKIENEESKENLIKKLPSFTDFINSK